MTVEHGPQETGSELSRLTPDELVDMSVSQEGVTITGAVIAIIGLGAIGRAGLNLAREVQPTSTTAVSAETSIYAVVGVVLFALGAWMVKGGVNNMRMIANELRNRGLKVRGTPGFIIRYEKPNGQAPQ